VCVVVAGDLFLLREGPGRAARPPRTGGPPPASLAGTSRDDDAVLR
jgi:hypothetical protein